MERKLLFTVGNLYIGYAWGVEAELPFGTFEIHGPFSSENDANNYAHRLVKEHPFAEPGMPYQSVKVVRIETPQAGKRIVRNAAGDYEYAV